MKDCSRVQIGPGMSCGAGSGGIQRNGFQNAVAGLTVAAAVAVAAAVTPAVGVGIGDVSDGWVRPADGGCALKRVSSFTTWAASNSAAVVVTDFRADATGLESEAAALLTLSAGFDTALVRLVLPVADFFGPALDLAESDALDESDLPVSALATPWLAAATAAPTPTATASPPTYPTYLFDPIC